MMGLFNLGKKKDIPMPPKPDFSEPRPPESEQPKPSEPIETVDFDELSDITPPSPADSPPANNQGTEDFTAEPAPLQPVQPSSPPESKKGFELPDFIDEEMKALKEAKEMMKEAEKKQELPKQAPPPEKPKPEIYTVEKKEDFTTFAEPPKQKISIEKPFYLEPKAPALSKSKEPFMNINKYLELKDDFENIRKLMLTAQDMIEQDEILGREKSDKYQVIAESLNFLQEKLILIDTKLFED